MTSRCYGGRSRSPGPPATTATSRSAHAEVNLVRLAGPRYSRATLATMTLYASTEPCAMCSGAIYWSGIGTVVYALGGDTFDDLTGSDPDVPTLRLSCREVFSRGQPEIEVRGPFPLPEAVAVHDGFWTRAAQ